MRLIFMATREEVLRQSRGRLNCQVDDFPFLHHLFLFQDGDAIANVFYYSHIMRNQHNRQPDALIQLPQKIQDRTSCVRVTSRQTTLPLPKR